MRNYLHEPTQSEINDVIEALVSVTPARIRNEWDLLDYELPVQRELPTWEGDGVKFWQIVFRYACRQLSEARGGGNEDSYDH